MKTLEVQTTFNVIPGGGGSPQPVPVLLTYNPADPYAITLRFRVSTQSEVEVVWVIDRDLVRDGLLVKALVSPAARRARLHLLRTRIPIPPPRAGSRAGALGQGADAADAARDHRVRAAR